jgi:anti-sigma factor NepR-like protein
MSGNQLGQIEGHHMEEDDQRPTADKNRKLKRNVSALPAQLGEKLRELFADVEAQAVPDRLAELLEQLAAKEKKAE